VPFLDDFMQLIRNTTNFIFMLASGYSDLCLKKTKYENKRCNIPSVIRGKNSPCQKRILPAT
jgi:hypothetical protein